MQQQTNLRYRLYGLVNYQLSQIQAGIQFSHAALEYSQKVRDYTKQTEIWEKFVNEDKTVILLNGGTTSDDSNNLGGLQKVLQTIKDLGIFVAEFREPDLNNCLTAICFLVDERCWDEVKYPSQFVYETQNSIDISYEDYEDYLGKENVFLRPYLKQFRLA